MLTIPNVAPVTFTREINLGASGGTLICAKNGANSSVFSGSITGVGFLNIYNSYLYINGTSNTYSGGTNVEAGTLIVTSNHAVPDGTNLTVGAGGTFIFDPSQDATPVTAAAVPEPGPLVLLAVGAALVGFTTWRRRKN